MSTRVVTVAADDDLAEALAKMSDYGVRRLPVVRTVGGDTVVVGIISDRDVRLAADSPYVHGDVGDVLGQLRHLKVGDVMTRDVVTVFPSASIVLAAQLMLRQRIGGVPVVEQEDGRQFLVGMLTRSDLLRYLITVETAAEAPAP